MTRRVIHVPRPGWGTIAQALAAAHSVGDIAIDTETGDIMPGAPSFPTHIPLEESVINVGFQPRNFGSSEPLPIDVVWQMERSRLDFHPDGGLVFTGPTPRRRYSRAERKAATAWVNAKLRPKIRPWVRQPECSLSEILRIARLMGVR